MSPLFVDGSRFAVHVSTSSPCDELMGAASGPGRYYSPFAIHYLPSSTPGLLKQATPAGGGNKKDALRVLLTVHAERVEA